MYMSLVLFHSITSSGNCFTCGMLDYIALFTAVAVLPHLHFFLDIAKRKYMLRDLFFASLFITSFHSQEKQKGSLASAMLFTGCQSAVLGCLFAPLYIYIDGWIEYVDVTEQCLYRFSSSYSSYWLFLFFLLKKKKLLAAASKLIHLFTFGHTNVQRRRIFFSSSSFLLPPSFF